MHSRVHQPLSRPGGGPQTYPIPAYVQVGPGMVRSNCRRGWPMQFFPDRFLQNAGSRLILSDGSGVTETTVPEAQDSDGGMDGATDPSTGRIWWICCVTSQPDRTKRGKRGARHKGPGSPENPGGFKQALGLALGFNALVRPGIRVLCAAPGPGFRSDGVAGVASVGRRGGAGLG